MKYQEEFDRWFANDGDNRHLLTHNLNKDSIVFDVGGYIGDFTEDIFLRYNSRIFTFEPIEEYYNIILNKFSDTNNIKIFKFGLASEDKKLNIAVEGDASSFHKAKYNAKLLTCEVKKFSDFFEKNDINYIDLLKINIEGDEYDLIEHIIDTGIISKINFLQVQFHDFVENAEEKRENIRKLLQKTHTCEFEYKFVWEGWKRA